MKKWVIGGGVTLLLLAGVAGYLARATIRTRNSAEAFARDAIGRLTAKWDPDEFFSLASADLRSRSPRDTVADTMASLQKQLGAVGAMKLTRWYVERRLVGGAAVTQATLSFDGKFERGPARVDLVLLRQQDGRWAIAQLQFTPG